MVHERAYIVAMNSCINGYNTIRMWTYHFGMMKVMRLTSMEAEKEDTESLALLMRLFNEAVSKVLGQEGYKFNSYGIMCDKNGTNLNAIEQLFGTMYIGKSVTCQWHFRVCQEAVIKCKSTREGKLSKVSTYRYAMQVQQVNMKGKVTT